MKINISGLDSLCSFEFDDVKTASFNAVCGLLCWVGYFRTKGESDGDE